MILLPYCNYLCGCYHYSNKGGWQQTRISHIKLLEPGTQVIHILLLTNRKRMECRRYSTIFNSGKIPCYLQGTYVCNSLYPCTTLAPHVECTHVVSYVIKPTMSVYIVHEQLRHHQLVVHTLARSEDLPIHVVHALFHMQVLFKFKSSCTIYYCH